MNPMTLSDPAHINLRIRRVPPALQARVREIINDLLKMPQGPQALGYSRDWRIDITQNGVVVCRIVGNGTVIRTILEAGQPNIPRDSFGLKQLGLAKGSKTPTKEVSLLEEVFQEAEYNELFETTEEPIPPTLRSPGAPPPPANDPEPPTVRLPLPRKTQSYRPSTAAPLTKMGPRQSIRREYEMPLIQEIFMEAEEEIIGPGGRWSCQNIPCNVESLRDKKTGKLINQNCPKRVFGSSRGFSSDIEACGKAQEDANNKVPQGCYKRHCDCYKCSKR